MKRFCSYLLLAGFSLYFLIGIISVSDASAKRRVAVLYFEDHSRFDSSTGCGCVPGFISKIFGTKKRWDLEAGFAKMLNRKLVETNVYQPVSKDELLDAMAQMTLSRHSLRKLDKAQRATLAKHLNADVIVRGDIRKFNQERLKTNASRTLRESGRESRQATTSFMTGIQVLGHLYRATIKLDIDFYDAEGNKLDVKFYDANGNAGSLLSVSRNHTYAGTKVASLEASVTEEGTNLSFGQTSDKQRRNPRPIVSPTELNKIDFATTQADVDADHPHHYNETLLGMVTNEALIKVVLALRDNVGPNFITPWETQPETAEKKPKAPETAADGPIKGKIQHVDNEDPNNVYINIGSGKGIAINQQFAVYGRGKAIRDVDTGEILTYLPRKIAIVAVAEILSEKISIFRIVEGTDALNRGDEVREITADEADKTEEQ